MLKCTSVLAAIFLFHTVAPLKHIEWGEETCILIDIDAFNNLEWIDQHGEVTVAANFSFDDVYVTEGSCDLPNPYVGGLWSDGKSFELVFYNNSGRANVQMNIYFNPTEVFKHNLTDNVRNIVYFDAGPIGKAYRCETTTSHVTKVHVGKEAYQYSFGITSINIQGYNVSGGKFGEVFGVNDINNVSGSCGDSTINVLYITFYNNWQLNITVKRENSIVGNFGGGATDVFWWSHIYVQCFYNTTSPDKTPWFLHVDPKSAKIPVVISSALKRKPLQARLNGSYICNAQSKLDLGYGNSLSMWNLQYNAFEPGPDTTFSDKDITECAADSTTKGDTYIYVGIGLGVIVTMVMIVYIAGRCCYRKNFEEM